MPAGQAGGWRYRRRPPSAYCSRNAPFADDESVEEDVVTSSTLLSAREVKVDPLLPAALEDLLPRARRVAAGPGLIGIGEQHACASY
ncbi:MAG: hypothetical protein U0793_19675 [Gemmataceae bacterium]